MGFIQLVRVGLIGLACGNVVGWDWRQNRIRIDLTYWLVDWRIITTRSVIFQRICLVLVIGLVGVRIGVLCGILIIVAVCVVGLMIWR